MADNGNNGMNRRLTLLEGRQVGVTTYRVGTRFGCRVDNVDPGDIIGRGSGATVEEAEKSALGNAALMLNLSSSTQQLRRTVETLKGGSNKE